MKYYKISPEWAQKLNVKNGAPVHPDGWCLILPTRMNRILQQLPALGIEAETTEDAVKAIGGVVYSEEEAIRSQQGDPAYMMDRNPEPVAEVPQAPERVEEEVPAEETGVPATQTTETAVKVTRKKS